MFKKKINKRLNGVKDCEFEETTLLGSYLRFLEENLLRELWNR